MRRIAFCCMTVGACLLLSTGQAATWHVRAGEAGDGSQANPFGKIQTAIDAAASGDAIRVAQGAYAENLRAISKSLAIQGGWNAAFTERDPAVNVSTIDGQRTASCLVYANCESGELSGFTIVNGSASGPADSSTSCGGGIYCWYSSPVITNNTVHGNHARAYGGGIFAYGGAPLITGNVIQGNDSGVLVNDCGGGVYVFESQGDIIGNMIVDNIGGVTGGGIYCLRCSLAIVGNTIRGNRAQFASGIAGCESSLMIGGNSITGNWAAQLGAGAYLLECSSSVLVGNVIAGNRTDTNGGGVFLEDSTEIPLINDTIANNEADNGRAIGCYSHNPAIVSSTTITNCIIWQTAALDNSLVHAWGPATITISYSDIKGGAAAVVGSSTSTITWGEGNIDADPAFADPVAGDYHLKSKYGRWDPNALAWQLDAITSPCIDAGDPASSALNEPQPNFGRVNLGAYGNSPQASKSGWNIPGDADDNCIVNILDLIFIRARLGQSVGSGTNSKADMNADGLINILDLIAVRGKLNTRCR